MVKLTTAKRSAPMHHPIIGAGRRAMQRLASVKAHSCSATPKTHLTSLDLSWTSSPEASHPLLGHQPKHRVRLKQYDLNAEEHKRGEFPVKSDV
jgi:hypothetical protein